MLESIGFSKAIEEEDILKCLTQLFPKLEFQKVDLDSIAKLASNKTGFFIYHSASDFPVRIEILFKQQKNTKEREQYIAKAMSSMLSLRTIVGWQREGSSNPYLNIVYEDGKAYLADDFESKYAGDGEKNVVIIEELIDRKEYSFDELGNMKS